MTTITRVPVTTNTGAESQWLGRHKATGNHRISCELRSGKMNGQLIEAGAFVYLIRTPEGQQAIVYKHAIDMVSLGPTEALLAQPEPCPKIPSTRTEESAIDYWASQGGKHIVLHFSNARQLRAEFVDLTPYQIVVSRQGRNEPVVSMISKAALDYIILCK